MKTDIICLQPNQVLASWPIFATFLQKVWPNDIGMILDKALDNHFQLWLIFNTSTIKGMFITAVSIRDDEKFLQVMYVTGKLSKGDLKALCKVADKMKVHIGAKRIEGTTIRRASRLLHSLGCTQETDIWWRT